MDVQTGSSLSIDATGTWKVDQESSTIEVTADGFVGYKQPGTELETADFGSLIGRIGENGAPFFVGSDFDDPHPAAGRLYLQINDIPGSLDDNSGELELRIDT